MYQVVLIYVRKIIHACFLGDENEKNNNTGWYGSSKSFERKYAIILADRGVTTWLTAPLRYIILRDEGQQGPWRATILNRVRIRVYI